MDELTNVNEVAEEVEATDGQFGANITDAEFDAMWDDDDGGNYEFVETESEEADQQTEEPVEEETEPTEAEQPQGESSDQDYLELKHFDEVRKVSKEEAKTLAQKGMDYDRIRGKLGEAENTIQQLQKYESFLKEIQGDFKTLDDLMMDTRARVKSDKEGISYEDALKQVKEANQPKAPEQPQVSESEIMQKILHASFVEFFHDHPDMKPSDVPDEVMKDLENTNNLSASYAKYEKKKLQDEIAVLKKNAENKSRSVGSMKSSGKAQRDEFDAMWYEDDY